MQLVARCDAQGRGCPYGAYPATAGGAGGAGSGRAVPRFRHIGCVVSHGAAAVSYCVRVIGTCVTCVTCAGRATMTRRGGGGGIGKCAAARAVKWVSSYGMCFACRAYNGYRNASGYTAPWD